MTITAKYAATCPTCNSPIRPGDAIEWSKGAKARHVRCAGIVAGGDKDKYTGMTQADRARGRWTGCSCGSRADAYGDLIPSTRNCSSCRHDA